jgi:hypothetical protein
MSKESADGVLFSTYSTLTSTKGKTTRVDQIAEWCETAYPHFYPIAPISIHTHTHI